VHYFNHGYHRSGTLWKVRFRPCRTQGKTYVLVGYRYIKLNLEPWLSISAIIS